MTISITRSDANRHPHVRRSALRGRHGFSLVELLITMAISSLALAAVLSTVTLVARSCMSVSDYADMDREARLGLEVFARDVRMAREVTALSQNSVTLEVVTSSGTSVVTYSFVPAQKNFYRAYGTPGQRVLIKNIDQFSFTGYSIVIDSATGLPLQTTNPLEAKQIQLELRSIRSGPAKAFTSNNVVSARYILRNKGTP